MHRHHLGLLLSAHISDLSHERRPVLIGLEPHSPIGTLLYSLTHCHSTATERSPSSRAFEPTTPVPIFPPQQRLDATTTLTTVTTISNDLLARVRRLTCNVAARPHASSATYRMSNTTLGPSVSSADACSRQPRLEPLSRQFYTHFPHAVLVEDCHVAIDLHRRHNAHAHTRDSEFALKMHLIDRRESRYRRRSRSAGRDLQKSEGDRRDRSETENRVAGPVDALERELGGGVPDEVADAVPGVEGEGERDRRLDEEL